MKRKTAKDYRAEIHLLTHARDELARQVNSLRYDLSSTQTAARLAEDTLQQAKERLRIVTGDYTRIAAAEGEYKSKLEAASLINTDLQHRNKLQEGIINRLERENDRLLTIGYAFAKEQARDYV